MESRNTLQFKCREISSPGFKILLLNLNTRIHVKGMLEEPDITPNLLHELVADRKLTT